MKNIKARYNFLNIAVLLVSTALFIFEYWNVEAVFQNEGLAHILLVIVTALVVHAIKAGRLYLAMYGLEIGVVQYLKVYCKVTLVSVVIPFKLGEFFRMYCYGKMRGNMLKGIVIVLLDRFMDTLALVTIILLIWIFKGGHITSFMYLLLIFLVLVLVVYFVFPGVYKFWKHYILGAKATKRKLSILKMLKGLNRIYEEIDEISMGRGIILYFMSLIAWGVEAGNVVLQNGLANNGDINQLLLDYLVSTMESVRTAELKQFVFISVIMMIAIYAIIKIGELLSGRKNKNESDCNLRRYRSEK